ncbi:substrate-binding domain-containing protein [bacterium]|nr:substrate-binding domain-containing protein [bacterium]
MPFSKLWDLFRENKLFYCVLGFIFCLLVAGIVYGALYQHHLIGINHSADIIQPFPNFILNSILIFLAGLAALVFMAWLHHKYDWKASEDVIHQLYEITETDTKAFSNVMSELAQGDLSASLHIQSIQLTEKQNQQEELAVLLKNIIQGLQDCAHELNTLTDVPCHRLCYIGADSFLEGQKCGQVMGELLKGQGEVIIIVGLYSATNFELRRKGFINALRTKFPRIKVLKVLEDHEDHEKTYQYTKEAIEQYPRLRGIYITQGATPFGAARAVQEKNKVGLIKIVGHDLTDSTMEYLSKGIIQATLDQNAYAQGYNPVILLYNYLVGDWKPFSPRMLTQLNVVTPENYQQFWHPDHGMIQSQESLNQLVKLSDKMNDRPLRIAVLCVATSAFWEPVKAAVMNAKEQLISHNVTIDYIVPPGYSDLRAGAVFRKALESAINEKYDGIATLVLDRSMIPMINKAVKKGIPVITFNSEPISLQGLIQSITDQAEKLMHFSEDLGNNADEANHLTQKIIEAMHMISEGSVLQNNQVSHTQDILKNLLANINQVNQATEEGAKATANTAIAITDGANSMEKTLSIVKNVETSVTESWQTIEELDKHSERIDNVVDLIQDITSRINVLAFNASIEAIQAGNEGQGFMVVANEVRRLARNTDKATQGIIKLVNQVKKDISKIENVMRSGLSQVQESAKQTTDARSALHNIRSLVETDQSRLKSIADAVAEIQTYSYRVEEAMNLVTEVSEKNTESVQNVNQATKDMVLQFQQVTQLAETLEMMAQSELELLGKFNVSTHLLDNMEVIDSTS